MKFRRILRSERLAAATVCATFFASTLHLQSASAQSTPPDETRVEGTTIERRTTQAPVPNYTNGRDESGDIADVSVALLDVDYESEEYDIAFDRRAELIEIVGVSQQSIQDASAELFSQRAYLVSLEQRVLRTAFRVKKAVDANVLLEEEVRELAVSRYMGDFDQDLIPSMSSGVNVRIEESYSTTLGSTASNTSVVLFAASNARVARLTADQESLEAELADTVEDIASLELLARNAQQAIEESMNELSYVGNDLRAARTMALVEESDMPGVALDAYWRATEKLAVEQPSCGLTWWGLAGIGRTESDHGRYISRTVDNFGNISTPVIGIPLDGTNDTQRIADSDGGELDGDVVFDRAVGPMQFIPQTWSRYAADISGDGNADPQNIYDAAYAAANYLCAYGPGLNTDAGLRRAYFGYNHSNSYVSTVLRRSRAYEKLGVPELDLSATNGAVATNGDVSDSE